MNLSKVFLVAFLSFLLGSAFVYFYQESRYKNLESDVWNMAKTRMYETNYFQVPDENIPINGVSGVVQKIEGNNITVKISPLGPMADPGLDNRVVVIVSDTKIQKVQKMDQAEYDKKLKEIEVNSQTDFDSVIAPSPTVVVDVDFESIIVGASLNVIADKNIRDLKQFDAEKVIIQL